MAVKMLACMSSKNMEESVEVNYEKENELKTPTRSVSKSNLRKTKSFTCQTLIHPSWSIKSQGNHSRELSRDRNRDESITPPLSGPQSEGHEDVAPGKPGGKGWKSFFSALQCSRTPLRSTDFKGMASKLTAGACAHSCGKPGSSSASEHDAAQAVHPDMSMDSADSYNDAKALLPVVQELNSTSTKDDQEGNLGDDVPAGVPVSARSSQAARLSQAARPSQAASLSQAPLPEQKSNPPSKPPTPRNESPTYASYHMANGTAVKVPEELRNLNRLIPPGAGVPGTEWFSQVELGVFITFVTLSNGCNALKRIRFSRDIFSKKEAEAWWAENGNRVRSVYNVPAFERTAANDHQATSSSEEEQVSGVSGYATPAYSPQGSRGFSSRESPAGYSSSGISRGASLREASSREASIREASIRESIRESMRDAVSEVSDSVTCERATETETHGSEEGSERTFDGEETTWVEEDVPGVYLTLKNLTGGGRELKRVRFSREKFTEKQAKIWWDENRGRIHKQYL